MRRLTRYGVILTAGVLAAGVAGCTAGSSSSSSSSSGSTNGQTSANSTLTISNENGALWTCGFNPLNSSYNLLSVGFIYEPLVYVNPLQSGKTTPMLASSYSWGAGNKSLTFTIRQGVKWSDGTPLTAADEIHLQPGKEVPRPRPDRGLVGLAQRDLDQQHRHHGLQHGCRAVLLLHRPDQTPIVPEHIWSTIANPATDSIKNPVGTGPYVMSKCSPQNITYTANPHYWQPGLPRIHTLQYPAFTSNATANDTLASGQAQWGAQYIPDIESFYSSKNPNFHYWFPPVLNVSMVPNLTNPLLSNIKVREAMSYAIEREKVSTIGESGYEPPANQTGVVTPTFSSSLDSQALASWGSAYDAAKAKSLLQSAGYHPGSDGIMTNAAGQKLQFTVINIGDYSDWVASMQVIQQDLKAVGISITPSNLSNTDYQADLINGHYQLAYVEQYTFGPGAYYELNNWLNSANTAPVGKQAASNYERYSNPATDALLKQYSTTTDTATQQTILNPLQQVMLTQVPFIPVVEGVDWYQYDTTSISGWPTSSNPYAQPPVWAFPDNEQVLLHLSPK
jgi:peptide/nickel transport system substrate-binding protein